MSGVGRFFLIITLTACVTLSNAYGMDRSLNKKLRTAFEAGELEGLHSILVMHKDTVFAEAHFKGKDERWGAPIGERQHGPQSIHDLRSVTKSIVSLLYGIALSRGKVPKLDESLLAQFPQYSDLAKDPKRNTILIGHALSMKMGTQWSEDLPYSNPENSEIAMELAKDRYRYVLDRPMIHKPGEKWVYNGGAVAIIAKLIADGVGMPLDKYAEEVLFKPLGIKDFEWVKGEDGVPSAASGLRMNIHGLAKIGQLILHGGKVGTKQIVPAAWLASSFTPRSNLGTGLRYGYFWWLAPTSHDGLPSWFAGFGNGGQRLTVHKKSGSIIVVFAGNYNHADGWKLPVKLIEKFVAPALRAGK